MYYSIMGFVGNITVFLTITEFGYDLTKLPLRITVDDTVFWTRVVVPINNTV